MVNETFLTPDNRLPLVIEPESGRIEVASLEALLSWYGSHQPLIEQKLMASAAILFRGFKVTTPSAFARFVRTISGDLLDYIDGNAPRNKLTAGIYTSSEYPPEYFISLHSELSYSHRWPDKLYFCCITPPKEGGQTPIADNRAILRSLSPQIAEEFTRKQVKYIRNLHAGRGFGPSWQETFETSDPETVNRYCQDASIDCTWKEDGSLRLVQIRPAVATHPKTGEKVWFNQADQFHPSTHSKDIYQSIESLYRGRENEMPQSACFGDNTPIDISALEEIRETVRSQMIAFPWQQGDVLVVDNLLACHGRMPFVGPRKILVAMS
jgi:alpha-ketoglutarate-dependent taurine dioxygenase